MFSLCGCRLRGSNVAVWYSKKYTLFVILMGQGSKHKMEQNEDGQFGLYEQCTGNGCGYPKEHSEWPVLKAFPTFPECVDLDEYVLEVADIIYERYKKSEGYESSANITSDEAYVDGSDLDSDKSSDFQHSMTKIRRNNRLDLQELMIMAH